MKLKSFILVLLLLAASKMSWAVSLYDVIQLSKAGRSDEEIIKLIDDTHAQFELDAESIATLKEAGVNERIIQALVNASAPRAPTSAETAQPRESRAAEARLSYGGYSQQEAAPGTIISDLRRSLVRLGALFSVLAIQIMFNGRAQITHYNRHMILR